MNEFFLFHPLIGTVSCALLKETFIREGEIAFFSTYINVVDASEDITLYIFTIKAMEAY